MQRSLELLRKRLHLIETLSMDGGESSRGSGGVGESSRGSGGVGESSRGSGGVGAKRKFPEGEYDAEELFAWLKDGVVWWESEDDPLEYGIVRSRLRKAGIRLDVKLHKNVRQNGRLIDNFIVDSKDSRDWIFRFIADYDHATKRWATIIYYGYFGDDLDLEHHLTAPTLFRKNFMDEELFETCAFRAPTAGDVLSIKKTPDGPLKHYFGDFLYEINKALTRQYGLAFFSQ
jgi:hypothetical protein